MQEPVVVVVVVVALDESPGSMRALEWACHYAQLAGASIDAVHVWGSPDGSAHRTISDAENTLKEAALEGLRVRVSRYADEHHPGVAINARVVHGPVVDVLVDESHRADLIVIGRRAQGDHSHERMGSISRGVVEHASCPVVVVHPDDHPRSARPT